MDASPKRQKIEFDDAPSPAAARSQQSSVMPPTTPTSEGEAVKRRGDLRWLVYLLAGVSALALIAGSFGMTYPGSSLVDPVFRLIGRWVFQSAFHGNFINAGYGVVAWSILIGTLVYMRMRK